MGDVVKAFKYKIRRPNKVVIERFIQTLDLCRELYNSALQERRDAWQLNRVSISFFDQANQLKDIKTVRSDLTVVYSQVLQDVLKRLDKTFKAFFGRVKKGVKPGFPRFKGKRFFNSFCFPQRGFKLVGDKLTLSKIGMMRVRLSRNIEGEIKTCSIKQEADGWYVIFICETEKTLLKPTNAIIGIDVGIENFATLSDGTQIDNWKYYEASAKELRIAQRRVSRRKKGSGQRRKAVIQSRKIHQNIVNQRADFQHKLSTDLINQYDLIAIEKLNIKGMSRGILSKQVNDVAWANFFDKLSYKAANAGRKLIEVDPRGTSQTCTCGAVVKKSLATRWHDCIVCGLSEHRDIVSAKVILNRAVGQTVKELTYDTSHCVSLVSP